MSYDYSRPQQFQGNARNETNSTSYLSGASQYTSGGQQPSQSHQNHEFERIQSQARPQAVGGETRNTEWEQFFSQNTNTNMQGQSSQPFNNAAQSFQQQHALPNTSYSNERQTERAFYEGQQNYSTQRPTQIAPQSTVAPQAGRYSNQMQHVSASSAIQPIQQQQQQSQQFVTRLPNSRFDTEPNTFEPTYRPQSSYSAVNANSQNSGTGMALGSVGVSQSVYTDNSRLTAVRQTIAAATDSSRSRDAYDPFGDTPVLPTRVAAVQALGSSAAYDQSLSRGLASHSGHASLAPQHLLQQQQQSQSHGLLQVQGGVQVQGYAHPQEARVNDRDREYPDSRYAAGGATATAGSMASGVYSHMQPVNSQSSPRYDTYSMSSAVSSGSNSMLPSPAAATATGRLQPIAGDVRYKASDPVTGRGAPSTGALASSHHFGNIPHAQQQASVASRYASSENGLMPSASSMSSSPAGAYNSTQQQMTAAYSSRPMTQTANVPIQQPHNQGNWSNAPQEQYLKTSGFGKLYFAFISHAATIATDAPPYLGAPHSQHAAPTNSEYVSYQSQQSRFTTVDTSYNPPAISQNRWTDNNTSSTPTVKQAYSASTPTVASRQFAASGASNLPGPRFAKSGPTTSKPTYSTSATSNSKFQGRGRSRSRSRSPPYKPNVNKSISRRSRSRSNSEDSMRRGSSARKVRSPPRAPPANDVQSGPKFVPKVDYAKMTDAQLSDDFHAPCIDRNCGVLAIKDMLAKFPNMYVPADFMRLEMDWQAVGEAINNEMISSLPVTAPILFENSPAAMSVGSESPQCAALLEPPKFTFATPSLPVNNKHILTAAKPIKFNARVLISLGFRDSEAERVDCTVSRKLRLLCGRRKGTIMLLGGAWCQDLDGGNPLEDRSCLLNTARRAVLAQSLLDIGDATLCSVTKMCELCYHRPQEDFKGKQYPEQDESTVIYLCSVKTPTSAHQFEKNWEIYSMRAAGKDLGPSLHWSADESAAGRTLDENLKFGVAGITGGFHSVHSPDGLKSTPCSTASSSAEAKDDNPNLAVDVSMIIDTQCESVVPLNQTAEVLAVASSALGDAVQATANETNVKPSAPCALLCPQPLASDVSVDVTKKQDAISLRVLPLSSILSYTLDDSNERIFEASIAAEVLRSIFAVSFANLVTDVVLARQPLLHAVADPRILHSVRRLEQFAQANSQKNPATVKTIASTANTAAPAPAVQPGASDVAIPVPDNQSDKPAEDAASTTATDSSEGHILKKPKISLEDSAASEGAVTGGGSGDAEAAEESAAAVDNNEQHDDTLGVIVGTAEHGQVSEISDVEQMDLGEAKNYRQLFLAACRWFDVEQDRFLRMDHLQLIMYSAMRDVSRADLAIAVRNSCGKDEKFRYELFI